MPKTGGTGFFYDNFNNTVRVALVVIAHSNISKICRKSRSLHIHYGFTENLVFLFFCLVFSIGSTTWKPINEKSANRSIIIFLYSEGLHYQSYMHLYITLKTLITWWNFTLYKFLYRFLRSTDTKSYCKKLLKQWRKYNHGQQLRKQLAFA